MKTDWRERYRVRISLFVGLIFVLRAQPRYMFFLSLGLVIAFAGVLLRQWAAGCIKKMDELAVTGPYALVRHPLYAGSFLLGFGFLVSSLALLDRALLFWALFWILMDSVYLPKIRKEERLLEDKFGARYLNYCGKVPRFFPGRLNLSQFDFSGFSLNLWIKNQEYWGLVIYLIVSALLIARFIYAR